MSFTFKNKIKKNIIKKHIVIPKQTITQSQINLFFPDEEEEETNPDLSLKNNDYTVVDGEHCNKCSSFAPYAIPNMEDGSFECWKCRHGL